MKTAMDIVRISREPQRLKTMDCIKFLFTDFIQLHGDRAFGDDPSIICGLGRIKDRSVMIVGQQKDINFGMPNPEGYRKVIRVIKLAEKFNLPIISFVDTPGAGCGIEAEERGQAGAIANCILEFSKVKTPTVSIILGEGGSGGALAISTTDEIWMMENSIYSILSPEGFASILWKDPSRKEEAANLMRLTSENLMEDGFIDKIIYEDGGELFKVRDYLIEFLEKNSNMSMEKLLKKRYYKYRKII